MRTTVFSRLVLSSSCAESRARRLLPAALAASALLGAAGCSSFDSAPSARRVVAFFAPYRPEIVQGNVVTTDQISQIKPGMTRVQVRDVLGTPLISDPFHAQRWDYVFTLNRQGYEPIERAFYVAFQGDAVDKVEAPELPTEDQFVASIARTPLPTKTPKLELTDAERAALPAPKVVAVADAASATAQSGPARSYPPLESN
jgi:outer membrane protein assembly factor BamE